MGFRVTELVLGLVDGRQDTWFADNSPVIGNKEAGKRPLSNDEFGPNHIKVLPDQFLFDVSVHETFLLVYVLGLKWNTNLFPTNNLLLTGKLYDYLFNIVLGIELVTGISIQELAPEHYTTLKSCWRFAFQRAYRHSSWQVGLELVCSSIKNLGHA
ncbi:hypothetical protein JHK85_024891 [Glycine max]|nr:hypothetical protein JHK85_024891 [Glycine max]KAG5012143.1 hypothetical protein JHK86_024404 [Glycine max]